MNPPVNLGRTRRALESLVIDHDMALANQRILAHRHQATVEGQCVLLVDDDPTMRLTTCRQLALLGLACMVTTSARQAMRSWRQHPHAYWLVLIDLDTLCLDGFDLARGIRDHSCAGARIPIVAFSSLPSADLDERCQTAGVDECLAGPVSMPVLRRTLERRRPAARVHDLAQRA
jgi:CheY-like chemotaxis protein